MKKYNMRTALASLARLPRRLFRSFKKKLDKRQAIGPFIGPRYEVLILQHNKIVELEREVDRLKYELNTRKGA